MSSAVSDEHNKWPYTLHTAKPRPSYPAANAYPSVVHEIDFTLLYALALEEAVSGDHCRDAGSSILCENVGVDV